MVNKWLPSSGESQAESGAVGFGRRPFYNRQLGRSALIQGCHQIDKLNNFVVFSQAHALSDTSGRIPDPYCRAQPCLLQSPLGR
jgi:hypothetical protein